MKMISYSKKRLCALILAFCLIFLTSACAPENKDADTDIQKQEYTNEVEKFLELVSAGDYNDALEYYVENIAQNVILEEEAKSACINYYEEINKKYLDGTIDKATADLEYAKLKKVMDDINIMTFVPEYESEFDNITLSKENYELGVSAYESGNYISAINYFNGVIADDCNYKDAQSKITSSKDKYRESVFADAENKVAEDKYPEAIKILNDAISVLGADTQIKAKIDEYRNTYIKSEIAKAEEAFVDPKTDWETALNIIKAAQQHMPDNQELQNKRNYYENYEPVSLFDMHLFEQSESYELSNSTDNMGNVYENSMAFQWIGNTNDYYTGVNKTKPMKGVYILDKKYNTLNFIVAVEKANSDLDCYMTIRIYGDDSLLYDAGDLKGNTKPYQEEIDVTGVTNLKVCIEYNGRTGKTWYADGARKAIFAEPMLQCTKK